MMQDASGKGKLVPSARRRLLRAAFAAPSVLALHSGSALAASSNLRCVSNANASTAPDPAGVVGAVDGYVRVQLYERGNSNQWFLSGSSVQTVAVVGKAFSSFLQSGQWQEVLLGLNNSATLGSISSSQPGGTSLGAKWAALRFVANETGAGSVDIVGIIDGNSNGSAVAGTCWMSFVGMG